MMMHGAGGGLLSQHVVASTSRSVPPGFTLEATASEVRACMSYWAKTQKQLGKSGKCGWEKFFKGLSGYVFTFAN